MSFSVAGMGIAVPPHTMSQDEALGLAEQVLELDADKLRTLRAVYRRAGVKNRHTCVPYQTGFEWAELPSLPTTDSPARRGATTSLRMRLYQEHAPPLAVAAAKRALAESNLPPDSITHSVTVSCTGFAAPGVDTTLIRELGLSPETERVNVGFMGCHGAVNGLRAAAALAAADPNRRVLLTCVELCSLHYFFDAVPDKLVSNALFADGAASVVGSAEKNSKSSASTGFEVLDTGSCLLPDSLEAMGWEVGDYGFEMSLSATVPERIAVSLRPWLEGWLGKRGIPMREVAHWLVHPGGPRILAAVSEALELPPQALDASRKTLANYGNMSSPTVLFIAEEARQQREAGLAVMLAFGPGLTAEVTLARFGDPKAANPISISS